MQEIQLSGGVLETQLGLLPDGWRDLLAAELAADPARYTALDRVLTEAYQTQPVNPRQEHIFRAFQACPLEDTAVVLCGQDPYPNAEHAMGLSFSVPAGTRLPPSLKNIFKELESDLGAPSGAGDGDLTPWARQGVLLLNTSLTVREGASNSHKDLWEGFALGVLSRLNIARKRPLAFLLWGNQAREIGAVMERTAPAGCPRLFLYSVHPSPLSAYRGFFGSRPFSQINRFLEQYGEEPVKW